MYESAMSLTTKITTLANEVVRRCRNTDRLTVASERGEIITGLMRKMQKSGYPEGVRKQVLESGLQCYMKMVQGQRLGRRRVNRPRERERDVARLEAKLTAPATWFRMERNDVEEDEAGVTRLDNAGP